MNPLGTWPAQAGFGTVHFFGHVHFGGEQGAFAVAFVMPHGTGINKTFELVFIGIQEHTDEGVYVIDFPVGGDDGPGQGVF